MNALKKLVLVVGLMVLAGQAFAVPKMPLKPTAKGPLSGAVVVLDPGHGAADPGCRFQMDIGQTTQQYWEAAYTYVAAYDLADIVRRAGGTVYLTCWSDLAFKFKAKNAQQARPLPRDAVSYADHQLVMKSDKGGLLQRASYSNSVYHRLGRPNRFYFMSLHIDSIGSGEWRGSHVTVQPGRGSAFADALANYIQEYGVAWTNDSGLTVPLDQKNRGVLRDNDAPLALLWEMCTPQYGGDSYRIRGDANRRLFLERVGLAALINPKLDRPLRPMTTIRRNPNPTELPKDEQANSEILLTIFESVLFILGVAALLVGLGQVLFCYLISLAVAGVVYWADRRRPGYHWWMANAVGLCIMLLQIWAQKPIMWLVVVYLAGLLIACGGTNNPSISKRMGYVFWWPPILFYRWLSAWYHSG